MLSANYLCRLPGDILLISAPEGKSYNLAGQSLLRGRKVSFSHVAVTVDHGSIIHATPKNGVHLDDIDNILSQDDSRPIKVIRHVQLDQNDYLHKEIRERLIYYHCQKYNFSLSMRQKETSSYCSELAAKAYSDIGIPITKNSPKNTLPADIEKASKSNFWLDVSNLYLNPHKKNKYKIFDEHHLTTHLGDFFKETDDFMKHLSKDMRNMEETIHTVTKTQREVLALINKTNEKFEQEKLDLNIHPIYWDSDDS